ncbi:hypothetical protein ACOMHN_065781 [Nucella lapillus]
MSVWKREIFKWSRADAEKDQQYAIDDRQPLVALGNVDSTNADLKQLFSASVHGRRKEILEILHKGIWVDFPNDAGQTALFCTTLRGHYGTAELLLQNGANPNEKSDTGMTPVHVACLKASLHALGAMIQCGGDLRLHDNEGNGCVDWARYHPDPKKRMKMLEFLKKSQLFALNYSGDFLGNTLDRQPSILQMLRGKVSSQMSLDIGQETGLRKVHSHGYGRVYYGGDSASGVISVIPLLTENQLRLDTDGISFESTSGFVMTGMLWTMTPITIKQPNKKLQGHHSVDLLISEVEHLSKLRHPNILLLMGLCQSSSFDKVMLAFERVSIGSLHYILHEKIDHLPMTYIRDICTQVCQALLYIHGQNYIHCSLTCHAVFMTSMHQAKVGNLEYMVEMKKAFTGRTCLVATSPHKEHVFRWMAPEIMMGDPPSAASDVYSFCCVLWEMITSELPWKSKTYKELLELHESGDAKLASPTKAVALYQTMIEEGLRKDTKSRPQDFVVLLRWLQGPLDKAAGWKPNTLDRLKSLQRESTERISLSSRLTNMFGTPGITPISEEQSGSSQQSTTSTSESSSSSSATVHVQSTSVVTQTGMKVTGQQLDARKLTPTDRSASRNDSDITNNHNATEQQKPANLSNSCSATNNSKEDFDSEAVDGQSSMGESKESPCSRKRFVVHSAGQIGIQQLSKGDAALVKNQFNRSRSFSAATSFQKHSHRTASLPWQGSRGLPRAGSTSPCSSRLSQDVSRDSNIIERSKTLPLVKPASHSTAVQEFVRDNTAGAMQTFESVPRRTRRLSPRRSLPMSRNDPTVPSRVFPRSKSASGDVLEVSGKDVELSVPGSVRTLTEQFQAHLYNHNLRQSIIKGSMTPQGILFEDLDTSPISLRQTPNLSEIPPEGNRKNQENNLDREFLTASSKGSTESLTSVSFREESTADEDEEHAFPVPTKNELDITEEIIVLKPSHIYPPYSLHFQCESAANPNPRIFQGKSAFRKISKQRAVERDYTDGNPDGCENLSKKNQFLPSCLPGTDVSSHPFDFQDYYIDDDYTGDCNHDPKRSHSLKSRDCEATHITDGSRQRIRNRVWLGDNKREQNKRNWQNAVRVADYLRGKQQFIEQISVTDEYRKETQDNLTGNMIKHTKEKQKKLGNRKDKQCPATHWQREDHINEWATDCDHSPDPPEKNAEGQISPDPRQGKALGREWRITPEDMDTFSVEGEEPSSKEHFLNWDVDSDLRNWQAKDAEKPNWETERTSRESRWEEFVRRSQAKTGVSMGGNTKERACSPEYRPNDEDLRDNQFDGDSMFGPKIQTDNPTASDKENAYDHCDRSSVSLKTEDEDDPLVPASEGSSMSTVVEKPPQNLMSQPSSLSDEENDNDNDTTLVPEEVVDHPRCILLHLERNTLSQEDLQPRQGPVPRWHGTLRRDPTTLGDNDNDDNNENDDNDEVDSAAGKRSRKDDKKSITSSGKHTHGASEAAASSALPQSTLRKFYLGSTSGSQGYTTTLKVESSLLNPGSHRITHTACDVETGLTQTVHEETVKAETLKTTMGIQ